MKFSHALLLASSLAFFACGDDDDSPTGASSSKYDCSVSDGVKVVYPDVGSKFKMGDEITVVFGTAVEDNGYRILFRTSTSDRGIDLLDDSYDAKMDGKTCNEVKVKLSADLGVEPTLTGIIRVEPYNKSSKGDNSALFVVEK